MLKGNRLGNIKKELKVIDKLDYLRDLLLAYKLFPPLFN